MSGLSGPLTVAAPAKINWLLEVVGQNKNNYHLLRTFMQSISLMDEVYLEKSRVGDNCECPGVPAEHNLAVVAWQLLKHYSGCTGKISIKITKRIPLAAGLGGGSSNAAAVLYGANILFGLGLSQLELMQIGLQLGADVPFCLCGGLALAEGIGEKLTPYAFTQQQLLIINPGCAVSTREVFARWQADPQQGQAPKQGMPAAALAIASGNVERLAGTCYNQLEQAAMGLCPQIKLLKEQCAALGLLAVMSGSGASVWAAAPDADSLLQARTELARHYPLLFAVHTLPQGVHLVQ